MIILIPMGGEGTRFKNSGYKTNKAEILITDRKSGIKIPMIIASMKDLPGIKDKENTIICVDRKEYETNGTENLMSSYFSNIRFIHDEILLDQAYACYLARDHMKSDEELLIGNCDSGLNIDQKKFEEAKLHSDVIMFSQTKNDNIELDPNAHSWAVPRGSNSEISDISIKQSISRDPYFDHATTGIFWFKKASLFLKLLEEMIDSKDTFNDKYYVDKLLLYYLENDLKVTFLDVEYFCWGTPTDLQNYESTFRYWKEFLLTEI